jgi:uncharacterized membrane protein YfhO
MNKPKLRNNGQNSIYAWYSIIFLGVVIVVLAIFYYCGTHYIYLDDGISQNTVELKASVEAVKTLWGNSNNQFIHYNLTENNIIYRFFYWGIRNLLGIGLSDNSFCFLYIVWYFIQLYLAGLFFVIYCKQCKIHLSNASILIGAGIYILNGYTVYCLKQPEYLFTLALLPLLCLSIERIIEGKRGMMFAFGVWISAMCCSTYLYVVTLVLAMYILMALYNQYNRNIHGAFISSLKNLGRIIFWWILGVIPSSVLLVPYVIGIRNSSRMDMTISTSSLWHYDLEWYKTVFYNTFWERNGSTKISVSIVVYLAVIILIQAKKTRRENAMLVLSLVSIVLYMVPMWGLLAKGFANISNYWYFGLIFFLSVTTSFSIEHLKEIDRRYLLVCVVALIPIAIAYRKESLAEAFFIGAMLLCIIWLGIMGINRNWQKWINVAYVLVAVFTFTNGVVIYGQGVRTTAKNSLDSEQTLTDYYGSFVDSAAKDIEDDTFYRVEKYSNVGEFNLNLPQWYGYNGLSVFHSVLMNEICDYLIQTENAGYWCNNKIAGLDNRAMAEVLANTKYTLIPDGESVYVPYGFQLFQEGAGYNEKTSIYINDNYIPLVFTYDSVSCLSEEDAQCYSGVEKQELMLQLPIVEDAISQQTFEEGDYIISSKQLEYTVSELSGCEISDGVLHVTDKNNYVIFSVDAGGNGEMYFRISQLTPAEKRITYKVSCDGMSEELIQYEAGEFHKINRDAALINLGYKQVHGTYDITLNLTPGDYDMDQFSVVEQSMEHFNRYVEELQNESATITEEGTNYISGKIEVSQDKWMCISLPYNAGWKLYIDGKETETTKLNYVYMGALLTKGEHTIELRYCVPGLKIGVVLTIVGFGLWLFIGFKQSRRS